MASPSRCLRYLTLVADVLFMVLGAADAVLLLVLLLPLAALLPVPRWLLPPLLLPLVPALAAAPVGFLAFSAARAERRWRLTGVAGLQVLLAAALAVLAGWQVFLWFSPRVEADLAAMLNDTQREPRWHSVYHELRCCGAAGPASFLGAAGADSGAAGAGIPASCCSRDVAADAAPCSQLYPRGCVAPAADRVRAVLRDSAAVHGIAALLMLACAVSSAFYATSLKEAGKKKRTEQLALEEKPLRPPTLNQRF